MKIKMTTNWGIYPATRKPWLVQGETYDTSAGEISEDKARMLFNTGRAELVGDASDLFSKDAVNRPAITNRKARSNANSSKRSSNSK